MTKSNAGLEALRETAGKIKATVSAEKEIQPVVVGSLTVKSEVAEFYRRNARVGFENMSRDQLPTLKVTESNSKHLLADGSRPSIGKFYYTKTQQELASVEASFMTVSRGYYGPGMKKGDKPKFQQIIAGMILESMEPFIMYVHGKRLQPLWDLAKELSPFTKDKENPVPMMAFRVELTTTNYKHDFGDSHYINFRVLRDQKNNPELITDIETLDIIAAGIDSVEQAIDGIIEATAVDRNTGRSLRDMPGPEVGVTAQEAEEALTNSEEPI